MASRWLSRHIPRSDARLRRGEWKGGPGIELRGHTLGIVGPGAVGKELARRAHCLGMRVVATEERQDTAFAAQHEITFVLLAQLLQEADSVSLHCPLTPETRHFINARTLALMKPTAYLVNTARGPLIEQAALVRALRGSAIGGAALDVFEEESLRDNPFSEFDNVVLTPHNAGATREAFEAALPIALSNVVKVLRGDEPVGRIV